MSSDVASTRDDHRLQHRLLELLGLCTLALGQPLFALVNSSPEFFSARKTPRPAVAAFAVAVILGLPLLILLVEAVVTRARPGWGARLHDGLRWLLLGVIALGLLDELDLQLTRSAGVTAPGWLLLAVAAAFGAAALWLLRRSAGSRTFVRFLAVAAPAALLAFLASAPMGSSAAGPPTTARRPVPIVMVVMDELPVTSLLASSDQIDARRLPNFARLARDGTFYPNATTVADQTTAAVPALLSGRRGPRRIRAPELRSWPQNLFSLLRGQYRLRVREPITRLCPAALCPDEGRSTADAVAALASESSRLAYLSVAPNDLAPRSPLIGGADVRDAGRDVSSFLAGVRAGRRPTLDFLHVMTPHRPWGRLPSGRPYPVSGDGGVPEAVRQTLHLPRDRALALRLRRAHLLQVGYADRLLGRVIARLKRVGLWDRALVVVTADHGVSFRPGAPMRDATTSNIEEIAPVPLFVKRPQGRGRGTDPRPAQTVDVLPTILDAIGAPARGDLDGVSLLRAPEAPPRPVRVLSTKATYVSTTMAAIRRRRAQLLRIQRRDVIDSPEWRQHCRLPGSGCGPAAALSAASPAAAP